MPEHQEIEWKESWREEYLKWICGYANAHGGTLYIGKDDNGNVVGVDKSRKLLEDLPNTITNTMGIIVDVNLHTEDGKDFIEIIVDHYPSLISYRGKYYYRSGSVLREITGKELERALLKSQGRTWDGVPIPKLSVSDLKRDALDLFKQKAISRNRLTAEEVNVADEILLDNLFLFDDADYLTRAAMLAFYGKPEKWVTGSYIKIGFFQDSDADLRYQDEIHGPLIEQIDRTVDLVYTKYMKALIDYDGIQRTETFMFPVDAFREILLNAVVHKDYSACNPIQISVYTDKIYIWNDGRMPDNLRTTEQLFQKHSSKPFNPKLAHIFFMSGMIEAWGRGFEKIQTACEETMTPLPEYDISKEGIMVLCRANSQYLQLLNDKIRVNGVNGVNGVNSGANDGDDIAHDYASVLTEKELEVLRYIMAHPQAKLDEISNETGTKRRTLDRYISKMKKLSIVSQEGSTRENLWVVGK